MMILGVQQLKQIQILFLFPKWTVHSAVVTLEILGLNLCAKHASLTWLEKSLLSSVVSFFVSKELGTFQILPIYDG